MKQQSTSPLPLGFYTELTTGRTDPHHRPVFFSQVSNSTPCNTTEGHGSHCVGSGDHSPLCPCFAEESHGYTPITHPDIIYLTLFGWPVVLGVVHWLLWRFGL